MAGVYAHTPPGAIPRVQKKEERTFDPLFVEPSGFAGNPPCDPEVLGQRNSTASSATANPPQNPARTWAPLWHPR